MPAALIAEHSQTHPESVVSSDFDAQFQQIIAAEQWDEDPGFVQLNGALSSVVGVEYFDESPSATTPEHKPINDGDRLLTEVDHLARDLREFGDFRDETCRDVFQNLVTSIQEQAMPSAVTETRHEALYDEVRKARIFLWMGKTAVENAMSGYAFHRHKAALERVDVEVDEAQHSATLEFGRARVFISPRMTQVDASVEIAQEEHLHADDAVRVSWLESNGSTTERVMQSLLVKDVPFEAWVSLLEDPTSLFGKRIDLTDKSSALSVMKAHRELELPIDKLPCGPVSIVEAVIPHISDPLARSKVEEQLRRYQQKNQNDLMQQAQAKASEWLVFEKDLAVSLVGLQATPGIASFIQGMGKYWSAADKMIIDSHTSPQGYAMTRELASVLESAMQLFLSSRAALLADEEHVLMQVKDIHILKAMQRAERELMALSLNDLSAITLQNQAIARLGIRPNGGGCPGKNQTQFSSDVRSGLPGTEAGAVSGDEESETNEACFYSGTFCYCCPYNDDGTKATKPVTITAFRDSSGVATCQRTGCGATMKGNTVTYKGAIWERAQALEKQK